MKVYRYLEEKFLKEFFINGRLRLGSFSKYRAIENQTRKDPTDGSPLFISNDDYFFIGTPPNVFILCFSLENSQIISEKFKTQCGFSLDEINLDTFIKKVGEILGTSIAFSGNCDYIDECFFPDIKGLYFDKPTRISNRKIRIHPKSDVLFESKGLKRKMYNLSDKTIHCFNGYTYFIEKQNPILTEELIQAIFMKRLSFSPEKEFRIAWLIDKNKEVDTLDIRSLDLSKICKIFNSIS